MGRLQNNPSIGMVHQKSTHAHPLAWGNKNVILEEHGSHCPRMGPTLSITNPICARDCV